MKNIKNFNKFIKESLGNDSFEKITEDEYEEENDELHERPWDSTLNIDILNAVNMSCDIQRNLSDFKYGGGYFITLPVYNERDRWSSDEILFTLSSDYYMFIHYSFSVSYADDPYESELVYLYYKKDIGIGLNGFNLDMEIIRKDRIGAERQFHIDNGSISDGNVFNESAQGEDLDYEKISASEYRDHLPRRVSISENNIINRKEMCTEIRKVKEAVFGRDSDEQEYDIDVDYGADDKYLEFSFRGCMLNFSIDSDRYLYVNLEVDPWDNEDDFQFCYKIDFGYGEFNHLHTVLRILEQEIGQE